MEAIDSIKQEYEKLVASLGRERDEIRVQIHLANMEAKAEWEGIEHKWVKMTSKGKQIGEAVGETSEEVGEEVKKIGEEIIKGYKRLKGIL